MRVCWLNLGEAPDYPKLNYYGIENVAFDIRDPILRTRPGGLHYLDVVAGRMAVKPRVYIVQSWYPELSAVAFARKADQQLRDVAWSGNPAIDLDIEKGKPLTDATYVDFVVAALREWRRIRPTRETSLTFEPHQGGLYNNRYHDVLEISQRVNHIVPQAYAGDMTPASAGLVQNLTDYGFPRNKIRVCLDAAIAQEPWDGWLFTQGRLP